MSAPALTAASGSAADDDSATRPIMAPGAATAQPIEDETTRPAVPVDAQDPALSGSGGEATADLAGSAATGSSRKDVTADLPESVLPERTQTIPSPSMPDTESQTRPALPVDAPAAWPIPDIPPPSEPSTAPPVPAPESAPAPESPARKRSPLALIITILLIVLLLAVVAAGILYANGRLPFFGATPTASPTIAATATPMPTPTPPLALKAFSDADHIFSVGYPPNWLVSVRNVTGDQQRLVLFTDANAAATFEVGTTATTDIPAQQITDQVLAQLGQKTGIANRAGPTPTFVAGETWIQESGDVTLLVKGQPLAMHANALAVIHGSHTIFILTLAPVDTFPSIDPFFQQMQQSFEFAQ